MDGLLPSMGDKMDTGDKDELVALIGDNSAAAQILALTLALALIDGLEASGGLDKVGLRVIAGSLAQRAKKMDQDPIAQKAVLQAHQIVQKRIFE